MHTKLVAKTLIFNADKLILVIKRNPKDAHRPGGWDLPGGGVFEAEDPTSAALREIEEEVGIEVNLIRPLHIHSEHKASDIFNITIVFGAIAVDDKVALGNEHTEHAWVNLDDFTELDIPGKYKVAATTFVRSDTTI